MLSLTSPTFLRDFCIYRVKISDRIRIKIYCVHFSCFGSYFEKTLTVFNYTQYPKNNVKNLSVHLSQASALQQSPL